MRFRIFFTDEIKNNWSRNKLAILWELENSIISVLLITFTFWSFIPLSHFSCVRLEMKFWYSVFSLYTLTIKLQLYQDICIYIFIHHFLFLFVHYRLFYFFGIWAAFKNWLSVLFLNNFRYIYRKVSAHYKGVDFFFVSWFAVLVSFSFLSSSRVFVICFHYILPFTSIKGTIIPELFFSKNIVLIWNSFRIWIATEFRGWAF